LRGSFELGGVFASKKISGAFIDFLKEENG